MQELSIKWDSMNKVSFLEEELGWKRPEHRQDRFDCLIHCLGNYKWVKETGISVDGYTYSTMIRGNRMKRSYAILNGEIIEQSLAKEYLDVIQEIGLKDYKLPYFE